MKLELKEHEIDTVVGALRLLQVMLYRWDSEHPEAVNDIAHMLALTRGLHPMSTDGIDGLCDRIRDTR